MPVTRNCIIAAGTSDTPSSAATRFTGLRRSRPVYAPTKRSSLWVQATPRVRASFFLHRMWLKSGCWRVAATSISTMSRYLVDRITGLANVEVLTRTQVTALEGADGMLSAVHHRAATAETVRRPTRHLFLFIGAWAWTGDVLLTHNATVGRVAIVEDVVNSILVWGLSDLLLDKSVCVVEPISESTQRDKPEFRVRCKECDGLPPVMAMATDQAARAAQ